MFDELMAVVLLHTLFSPGLATCKAKGMMMDRLCEIVKRWWLDEEGVTSIEYVMLASLIALVIISSVDILGDRVCGRFKSVAEALGSAAIITCS